MTPYGIVYKDNLFALEQSCLVWQKKMGTLRLPALLKPIAIEAILIFIISGALILLNKEDAYFFIYTAAVMAVSFAVLTYFTFKTTYVKQLAKVNMALYQKQAVLFEDRIEFKSPYSRSVFYYDEILYWEEKAGILTIIIDKSMLPVSIYGSCVGKGSYNEFIRLFREKMSGGKEGI